MLSANRRFLSKFSEAFVLLVNYNEYAHKVKEYTLHYNLDVVSWYQFIDLQIKAYQNEYLTCRSNALPSDQLNTSAA